MVLKVEAFNLKKVPELSSDLVRFLYPDKSKRIQLSFLCSPQVLVFPTDQSEGIMRVNKSKRLSIKKNGHFNYGAWPQARVSPIQSKKLNQMVKDNQIRQAGHYYDLAGQACQEYELKEKRYVLIPDAGVWFEVQPIEWIYDFKTKKVHSHLAIWSKDELSSKQLASFGWQALQTNKLMAQIYNCQSQKQQILRDAESDMIHAIRFLRDKEKEAGIISGKGQKLFNMLHCQFYKNQQKGRK